MISEVNEAFQECFTTLWYGGLNETLFEMEPGHREREGERECTLNYSTKHRKSLKIHSHNLLRDLMDQHRLPTVTSRFKSMFTQGGWLRKTLALTLKGIG